MTVYVLLHCFAYEGSMVSDVFATPQAAHAAKKKLTKQLPDKRYEWYEVETWPVTDNRRV